MAFDVEAARKAGYSDAEIADHLAQSRGFDIKGARSSGYTDGEVIAHLGQGAAMPKAEPGFMAKAADVVTGNLRQTPQTQELPDWATMPELNELSFASAKTGLGTMMSSPEETVQIIRANFPDVQVRQDEKGNYLLRSSKDGKEYAIKPGFQMSDVPRAAGALAAFTPAGGASTVLGSAAAAGATQAVIEGSQAATGGTFNPADIAVAGAMGGVAPVIGGAVRMGANKVEQVLGRAAQVAPEQVPGGVPPVAPAAPGAVPPAAVTPAAPVTPMASPELAQTAKKAAEGSTKARDILAQQAAPDQETLAAAERLGIKDYLQPDHVTTNQSYRELAQAVKSIPGSQARQAEVQGLEQVGQRANALIEELGGSRDLSSVDAAVRATLEKTRTTFDEAAEKLYGEVKAALPPKTPATADSTLAFLKQHADEMGGVDRLTPAEKKLFAALNGEDGSPVTYAFLDQTRKDIGRGLSKASGTFENSESGLLKKLYSTLSDDQMRIAEQNGAGKLYEAAKAATRAKKGIEDDLTSIFGDKGIGRSLVGQLSTATNVLSKGDTQRLANLIKAVPVDMREQVMASSLTRAFDRNATTGALNFNTFANWFRGLEENQQAYTLVMANLPKSARQQLTDLARVATGIQKSQRERIVTGRIEAVRQELNGAETLVGRVYETAKRSAGGAVVGTALTPVLGPGVGAAVASALTRGTKTEAIKAADALIASMEFQQLAKAAANQGGNLNTRAMQFAKSRQFARFARALGNPRELSRGERWVLQSMQANQQRQ